MIAEYDPDKDDANRTKHGVPLLFGVRVFEDEEHIILPSLRPIDGEDRYKAVGKVDVKFWTALYIERGDAIRLFSVRRSNDGEQGSYDRHSGRSR